MRRVETLLALLAVVFASLSALNIPGRLILALLALLLLCIVISSRLRAAIRGKEQRAAGFDAYERAMQIQEERRNRMGR
jgi:hypothetical protein